MAKKKVTVIENNEPVKTVETLKAEREAKIKGQTKEDVSRRKNEALEIVKKSGGTITVKDLREYKGTSGLTIVGIRCPQCGRMRQPDMAIIIPCPGPFNAASERSMGGCNDMSYMRPDIRADYENKKESRAEYMKTKNTKKKEEKDMFKKEVPSKDKVIVGGKNLPIKKPVVAKGAPAPKAEVKKTGSVCAKIRELASAGKTKEQIIKLTGANPSTVSIQMSKAKKEK